MGDFKRNIKAQSSSFPDEIPLKMFRLHHVGCVKDLLLLSC